jgi:DNA-binding NarL/FixJ family response regulator
MKLSKAVSALRKPLRVMLVDDQPLSRLAARRLIEENQMICCAETGDAARAVSLLEANAPDLIIMDVAIRNGDGIELIKQAKLMAPQTRVLVVSRS